MALVALPATGEPPKLEWILDDADRLSVVLELGVDSGGSRDWSSALTAHVGRCAAHGKTPAMLARVDSDAGVVRLRPRFPLDPSADYCAVFDGSRLAGAAEAVAALHLTAEWTGTGDSTPLTVNRVLPAGVVLPANALRLYVEFSRPAHAGLVQQWARLWDESAASWVSAPFVDIPGGLWDPARRVLTLLFHPGRVKRGVGPNLAMGPPLAPGRDYRLSILPPGGERFDFRFRVGPEDRQAVDPARWSITAPIHGAGALSVSFGEPLDPFLVERWVGVETTAGDVIPTRSIVEPSGTRLDLEPLREWPSKPLELVVDTRLEDLAGNRVGRRFESDLNPDVEAAALPGTIRVPVPAKRNPD